MPLGSSCDDGDPNTVNDICTAGGCAGCTPDCAAKSCGDDGCGGECGSCGPAGTCETDSTCSYDLSCEDILTKDSTAPTGPHWIDPDGAGPEEAKEDYCDMNGPIVTYEDVAIGQYNASYTGYELLSLSDLQDSLTQDVFTWAYNAKGGLTNLMVGIMPGNCCFKEDTPGKYIAFGSGGRLFPCEGASPLCNDPLNEAVVGFRAGFATACATELSPDYFATHPPLIESGCDDANNPGFFLKKTIAVCQPLCDGVDCGDDGCGGSCGTCTGQDSCEGGSCVCQPECTNKVCGGDGCGGLCGTCASNETCEEDGEVCACQPSCAGNCGGDGCGGSCGTCFGQDACIGGSCVCQPSCAGDCGGDGCGGSCGTCSGQDICIGSSCVCQPSCVGGCGGDGCGGSCGTCGAGEICAAGQCECVPDCDGKVCGDNGCGGQCGACGAGESCNASGQCGCAPDCDGKSCGDDGCGGLCGYCEHTPLDMDGDDVISEGEGFYTEECTDAGQCVCKPFCLGECGDDGCGGSCGECAAGETCGPGGLLGWPTCNAPVSNSYECPALTLPNGMTITGAVNGDKYCVDNVNYKQCTSLSDDGANPLWWDWPCDLIFTGATCLQTSFTSATIECDTGF